MDLKLVPATIIETLNKNGAHKYDELYEKVERLHSNLSVETYNSTLMEMEIQGLLHVHEQTRGNKRIELV